MIIWNKIWDEVVHTDANRICARRYANIQRRISLAYKIAVPLLSGLCAFAVKYEENDAAFFTAIILCVSTVIKAIFPQLILPDKDIQALDKLQMVFLDYRAKAEDLMCRFSDKKISEDEARKELEPLQKGIDNKTVELNKLVIWIPWFIDRSITKESDRYLNAIHKNIYERQS